MARKTIKQRISLDGGKEVESQLRQLGVSGEKAFDKIRGAAARADLVRFSRSVDKLNRSLQTVAKRLTLAFVGITTAGSAAAAAVTSMAKAGADAADAANEAAQAAGLQIDVYGRLAFAADQAGVSGEQLGAAMSRLNKEISEAAAGGKTAQGKFAALGVSVRDVHGRLKPTEQIVHELADAFSKLPDGAKKSALAIALLGRAGAQLLPFFNQGKKEIIDLGKLAEELGIVFTDEQKVIADAMNDTLDQVSFAVKGITYQIGLLFAPAITKAAERLRNLLIANREAITNFARGIVDTALPLILDFMAALAGDDEAVRNPWVIKWRDAVIDFGRVMQAAFANVIVPAVKAFVEVMDLAAEALRIFTGIDISGAGLAMAVAVGYLTGALRLLFSAIGVVVNRLRLLGVTLNPYVAIFTAIAAAVAWFIKTQNNAAIAARQHQGAMDALDQAIANVKAGLPGAGAELKKVAEEQLNAAEAAVEFAKAQVAVQEQALAAAKQSAEMSAVGEAEKRFAGDIENSQKKWAQFQQQLIDQQNKLAEVRKKIAESAAAAAEAPAEQAKATSAAIDETKQKVEELGQTITVHSSEGGKPVQQVFELVNGVAQAAGESKAQLEGVTAAAQETAAAVSQITKSITSVPAIPAAKPGEEQAKPPAGITGSLVKPFQDARDRIAEILAAIPVLVSEGVAKMENAANGFGAGFADSLASPFKEASDRIASILTGLATTVDTRLAAIVSSVQAAVSRLRQSIAEMRALLSSVPEGGSGAGSRFVSGGRVSGPGTSTSDSIPVWLSDGEFVLRAAAVRKYGADLLYALNSMRLPKDFLERLGFASGGLVAALPHALSRLTDGMMIQPIAVPAFADGGAVVSGRPVNLTIDGQTFPMIAPDDVADRLAKHQGRQGLRRAGKRPGWK